MTSLITGFVHDSENTIFGPLGRDKARSQNSDLYGLTNIVGIVILIAKYQSKQKKSRNFCIEFGNQNATRFD